jgi:uncharacterized protein (UPF0218 family)
VTDARLVLPEALRGELKEPMGPVYTDADALAADAGRPLVAVGDIVTYHLLDACHRPDVALGDERTERAAVDPEIAAGITGFDAAVDVANPPGTLTFALLEAIQRGLSAEESTLVAVDGEEDLGALAAILAVPARGSVVYGQPGEGMVLVDPATATPAVRPLLERMDGDVEYALALLES